MNILHYTPGSKATIFLEINDGYLGRINPVGTPVVSSILLPDFSNDGYDGYNLPLTQLDVGLFAFQFQIPRGAISVGSYFIDVSYVHPLSLMINKVGYQLVVSAPYGYASITVPT